MNNRLESISAFMCLPKFAMVFAGRPDEAAMMPYLQLTTNIGARWVTAN
jgi:hypothetical protein